MQVPGRICVVNMDEDRFRSICEQDTRKKKKVLYNRYIHTHFQLIQIDLVLILKKLYYIHEKPIFL